MKISEIAALSGVSIGTVDRVIHNRGRVAPATELKVKNIIEKYGYTTNIIASNLKKGSSLKIGILIPLLNSEEGYWDLCYRGMKNALNEMEAFSVTYCTIEFDRMKNGDLLEKGKLLISKGIDVLAFAPVVQSESYQLITHLNSIPYAFFDSSLKNTHSITENLQDPHQAGFCAARVMELYRCGYRTFIDLQMHQTAYNQSQRAQGFVDYFKDKKVRILQYTWNECIDKLFFSFIDSLFLEVDRIDGIFMTNASTGILSNYIASKNLKEKPCIIGFDLLESNIKELQNGDIEALISQEPEIQGYNTMQEIYRIMILKRADTVSKSPIPISIIFKENIPQKNSLNA